MKKDSKSDVAQLRRKAEEELTRNSTRTDLNELQSDLQLLIHELQVHQVELEIQNEELIKAKEESELAREKYTDLYDFAPSAYFTLSREGDIIELNLYASQILGKDWQSLINCRLGFFVSDDTKHIFHQFRDLLFKNRTRNSCEVTLVGVGYGPVVVLLDGIVTGPMKQCHITAVDITARKRAEDSVRAKEERYLMLLEFASDAFFQGNENGNFIMVNSKAAELTGFSKDELLEMNMKDLFSKETLSKLPLKYEEARRGEITKTERELVRKDGSKIFIDMNSRMMPDGTLQSFLRDITERKRIEVALKQKLNEMEIYYELYVTRERKMIALKSEINQLLERLGEKAKY